MTFLRTTGQANSVAAEEKTCKKKSEKENNRTKKCEKAKRGNESQNPKKVLYSIWKAIFNCGARVLMAVGYTEYDILHYVQTKKKD